MTNLTQSKAYPWIVVAMLWFVALLNYLDRLMLSSMRPFMQKDIDALVSATNFGYLMAIFLWIYAFMSPFSGMIADRFNRKWIIFISLFIAGCGGIGISLAKDMDTLYVLRAIMGMGEALYIPAALSLIADYHQGPTRSRAIGMHTTGIYLGQACGGFGAVFAAHTSWQTTYLAFGIVCLVYSVLILSLLREKKTYTIDTAEKQSFGMSLSLAFKGFGVLFSNIAFWVIVFYFSAPSLPGWVTKNWLPTIFSNSLNMEMTKAAPMATMTLALSSFVGVLIGGFLADKWSQKTLRGRIYTGAIGLILTVPAIFLLGYGEGLVMRVAGAIIFGFGFGMFDVNNMPILCQFMPSRYRATGYGFMNLVGISAGAAITSLLGKALDGGNTNVVFAVMIAGVLIALLLQLTILRPQTLNMTDELMTQERKA